MGVLQRDPIPKLCFAMVLTSCKDFLFADCKDFFIIIIQIAQNKQKNTIKQTKQ